MDYEIFNQEINDQGFSIVENVLDDNFILKIKSQLEDAIITEKKYHKGTDYKDYGMILLCALHGGLFLDILNNEKLIKCFNTILGDGCILYAYTSSSMPPGKTNFSRRIHVDCPRIIPNYITNLGATILLDDFTEENGATYYLPFSHNRQDPPPEEEFTQKSVRLIAKAGSVWFFNARLWHRGGENHTSSWRHALTMNVCRPYMKQRIDIPRALSHLDMSNASQRVLQKLGFFAQVPANYEEYYVPYEMRKYKQKAE